MQAEFVHMAYNRTTSQKLGAALTMRLCTAAIGCLIAAQVTTQRATVNVATTAENGRNGPPPPQ